MKSCAVTKPLPRLKGEVPTAVGGEVTFPSLLCLPKRYFSRNSNIWLREPDGNSYNQSRVRKQVFAPYSNIWWGGRGRASC